VNQSRVQILTLVDAECLNVNFEPRKVIDSDLPLEVYQDFSSSEINSLTSFKRSSLTLPGNMTDDHGLEGLDVGPSQLASFGLTNQYRPEIEYLSSSRVVIDM
jgi:hypothetical protein